MIAPRVLLFTDSDAFAGTERHILTLASSLGETGACEVSIGCPPGTPLASAARGAGMRVVLVPHAAREALPWLRTASRKGEFEIVHAHNGRTCIFSSVATRGTSTARVFTQHFLSPARIDRRGISGWASRWIGAWALRRVHHTIAISDVVRQAALGRQDAPPDRVTTVLNGVAEPLGGASDPEVTGALRIGCVSRLSPEKRLNVLIDAMARLRQRRIHAHCSIWGDGQLASALAEQISRRDAPVLMCGHRVDVLDAVRSVDLFVLPCDVEAFGLSLVEAMALSKPVIAIDAGGPREIVVHGETGLLVPPNDPIALADAIQQLARDPDRRVAMGMAGRRRFLSRFTAERMGRETLAVYRAVLDRQRLGR